MSWLRKALAHLALARGDAALIKASGGQPREVRGMVLDPRYQYLEQIARQRMPNWSAMTPELMRARNEQFTDLFGGKPAGGVRRQRLYITGRSHSVPALLYLPTVRDNRAAMLIYYHYGGGVVGSANSCDRLCSLIAKMAGAPVLSVEYRLAPEFKFPAGLEDAIAAYHWGLANAARYGAPVGRVAVGGDSMGGGFAAVISQEMKGTRAPLPVLQLLIYPALDWTSDTASMHDFADAFPLTDEAAHFFISNYLPEGHDANDVRVSPGRAASLAGQPRALVYTAGFDILLDQGEAYADRLSESGVKVTRHRFETLPHGFVASPTVAKTSEAAIRRIARETADALKGG
jgi:acetyl esterase